MVDAVRPPFQIIPVVVLFFLQSASCSRLHSLNGSKHPQHRFQS